MFLPHVGTRIGENPCGAHARCPVRRENVRVRGRTLIPLNGDGAPTDTAEGGRVSHEPGQSENKDDDREDYTDDDLRARQPPVQGFVSKALRIAFPARRTSAFPGCARGGRGLVRRRRRTGRRRGSRRTRDERPQDWLQRRGDARLTRRSALCLPHCGREAIGDRRGTGRRRVFCGLLGGALRLRLASGRGGGIRVRGSPAGKVVAHPSFLPHARLRSTLIPRPGLVHPCDEARAPSQATPPLR